MPKCHILMKTGNQNQSGLSVKKPQKQELSVGLLLSTSFKRPILLRFFKESLFAHSNRCGICTSCSTTLFK